MSIGCKLGTALKHLWFGGLGIMKNMTDALDETDKEKGNLEKSKNRHGGARVGSGAKGYKFTDVERAQVEKLAGFGVPAYQIASLIRDGIDKETVTKYFSKEIASGKAKVNAKIGLSLYQQAIGGNTSAAIWWTKSQMGWSDQSRLDITSNGETIGGNDVVQAAIKRFFEANGTADTNTGVDGFGPTTK